MRKKVPRLGLVLMAGLLLGLLGPVELFAAAPLRLHNQLASFGYYNHKLTVPEGTTLFSAKVTEGCGDLDIFLKNGSPLSGSTLAELREDSDISSEGDAWQEIVALNRSSSPVLVPGDWYLAVVNLNENDTVYTVSVLLEPQPASPRKMYFPYIIEYNTWHSEVCLINASNTETVSGELVPYGFDGSPLAGSQTVTLSPNARQEFKIGEFFPNPQDIYYLIFTTLGDAVKGYAKVYVEGVYRVALPAVTEVNAGDLNISHIDSSSDWETEISLLNTTLESKEVTLEFNTGETKTRTLLPGAYDTFTISRLFDGSSQPGIKSAVVRNGKGVLGVELFSNRALSILEGFLLEDATADKIFFPHITVSDGWFTGFVVYNPQAETCELSLTPFDAAGSSLPPFQYSLAGHQKYIGSVADLGFPASAAWVRVEASHPVSGFELFMQYNQMGGYSGVNISGREGLFAKVGGGDIAGIALINQDILPAALSLTAYDEKGGVIASQNMTLGAYEKKVGVADNFFAESIAGATHIRFTADRQVVGFQLNFSPDGTMLDGLGIILIPEAAEIAGAGIIELAARALENGEQAAFVALLNGSSRLLVENMGAGFTMNTPAGAAAAVELAGALRRGRRTLCNNEVVHYETMLQGEIFNFHVDYDGDAGQWCLGGL